MLHSWHLDDDLDFEPGLAADELRRACSCTRPARGTCGPTPRAAIPNLVLAADYVRTHTDLASMEGACEAGRRATNVILERTGSSARRAPTCGRSRSRRSAC